MSNKYQGMSPTWGSRPRLTDWQTDRRSQCDFDFDYDLIRSQFSVSSKWSHFQMKSSRSEGNFVAVRKLKVLLEDFLR
jgi:hypothetical protein